LDSNLAGLTGIDIDDPDERAGHVVAGHFAFLLSVFGLDVRMLLDGTGLRNGAAWRLGVRLPVPSPRARARPPGRLYAIGGGPGANRIGYSPEEDAAHELARVVAREAGLEVEVDEAGNMFAAV
jgi:hypothetical protein